MRGFLTTIARLFSKEVDDVQTSSMVSDKVWLEVKPDSNNQFIFNSTGKFIYTNNGEVVEGNWDYVKSANVLIVDFVTEKRIFLITLLAENYLTLKDSNKYEELQFINFNHFSSKFRKMNELTYREILRDMRLTANLLDDSNREIIELKARLYDEKYGKK